MIQILILRQYVRSQALSFPTGSVRGGPGHARSNWLEYPRRGSGSAGWTTGVFCPCCV